MRDRIARWTRCYPAGRDHLAVLREHGADRDPARLQAGRAWARAVPSRRRQRGGLREAHRRQRYPAAGRVGTKGGPLDIAALLLWMVTKRQRAYTLLAARRPARGSRDSAAAPAKAPVEAGAPAPG